jgi:carbon-monoxide dehydrogenase medium subunit
MYTPDFHYHKAGSVAEAIEMLDHHEDSRLLAGGHSLLPLMRLRLARPATLIDIGGLDELRGIRVHDGHIHIGALTTHGEIARSQEVQDGNSLLAEVAGGIGDPQVRNRGTIGGNIAHADPASDWGTVLSALDASVEVQGSNGSRTVAVADFFQGAFSTAVADGEIVTGVRVPTLVSSEVGEYAKMSHPASFYPVIGGAVVINAEGGQCISARVAVGGLVPSPRRAPSVEAALAGQELTAGNLEAAANLLSNDLGDEIIGDLFASADYRRAIAPVEVKHAMLHAIGLAHH